MLALDCDREGDRHSEKYLKFTSRDIRKEWTTDRRDRTQQKSSQFARSTKTTSTTIYFDDSEYQYYFMMARAELNVIVVAKYERSGSDNCNVAPLFGLVTEYFQHQRTHKPLC